MRKATGVDVIAEPDRILEPRVSAVALVQASEEGWYTGKKLSDFLPGNYVNARQVINGMDKAATVAGHAKAFERALRAADYAPTAKSVLIAEDVQAAEPAVEDIPSVTAVAAKASVGSFIASILTAIARRLA